MILWLMVLVEWKMREAPEQPDASLVMEQQDDYAAGFNRLDSISISSR